MPSKKFFKLLSASLALCVVAAYFYYEQSKPHGLLVYYLNVGQGDSILIRTPDNQDILIDGGPDKAVLSELGKHLPFWDRDIELMILTHPHDDHVAGLVSVLNQYQVDKVLYNDAAYENNNYAEFKKIIKEKNIATANFFYGDKINLSPDIYFEGIFPFSNLDLNSIENVNNISIVNRLVYKENEFLFTGDTEQETEQLILENNINVKADVLKVGHHGSKTASTEAFLDAVKPKQAVISCGLGNKFKHPHFITLYKFKQRGVKIWRTDEDGTIKCEGDGVEIICEKML